MRVTAVVLGLVGGIVGFVFSIFAILAGSAASVMGTVSGGGLVFLAFVAMLASFAGVIGGALAMARPGTAAALMLIGAIVGFIALPGIYIVPGALMLIGGILAWFASRREPQAGEGTSYTPPTTPHPTA